MHPLRSLLLATLLLPIGCTKSGPDVLERLGNALPVKRGTEILESASYPRDVTCGRYRATTINGFSSVTREFIVTPEQVFTQPRERDLAVFCTEDPVAGLEEALGLTPEGDNDWSRMQRIHDDIQRLADAVLAYQEGNVALPRSLETLSERSELTEAQLRDPWGFPYHYQGGLSGMAVARPDIASLGADGETGGSGPDADIHLQDLPLVAHVLLLAKE